MKICINQYAFIAAILCITSALYPSNHNNSSESFDILMDQLLTIQQDMKHLLNASKVIEKQYVSAQSLNHKNRNISPKRRNLIQKLQRQATNTKNTTTLKINNIKRRINATEKQITNALSSATQNIKKTKYQRSVIPLE